MTHRAYVMTFLVALLLAALTQAQTFTTLYNFTGGSGGGYPYAGVIQDTSGNLYGTAVEGGSDDYGVVFKVTGESAETVLHGFTDGTRDGASPYTPVILDGKGNLYGTTTYGGSSSCGTVFKIDTAGKETVLHSFADNSSDGCYPSQGLVVDKFSNLYGTTYQGGYSGYGTVFEVTSAGKARILHSFSGGPSDGRYPFAGHLSIDKSGNLYGLTQQGGTSSQGVLYELTTKGSLTVLYSFAGGTSDGCDPFGSVAMDKKGDFYGTTDQCGSSNYGTVWKVSKTGAETVLHNFAGAPTDGCSPYGGVVLDPKGNLYGDTEGCGANNYGELYKLSANGNPTVLHNFSYGDGAGPIGEPLRTAKGELFGTTTFGGSDGSGCYGNGCGTVWSYVP